MFECTLEQGELFKKIVIALSDLVTEGNFQIDNNQISFQGMDSSHVSLVGLSLNSSGFNPYRCDRDITLGINFSSLNKILKCMTSKDQLSILANDESDSVFFTFASPNDKRVSKFELKLMDIDAEQLGIPQTEYMTTIKMPSSEFQRICRDLSAIGDSVIISANKDGVKFSVNGDIGSGDMVLKGRMTRRKQKSLDQDENDNDNDNNNDDQKNDIEVKNEEKQDSNQRNAVTQDIDGDQQMNNNDNNNDDQKNEMKVKNEEKSDDNDDNQQNAVTQDVDGDQAMNDDDDDDDNDNQNEEEYEANVDEDDSNEIIIELNESVTQTFALRYLNNFTKATTLSSFVTLSMGSEVPLMIEYKMEQLGYIRYYLAPKIDDEE